MKKNCSLFLKEKLPHVLNENELNQLFIDFKNGDMNAREKIITHNIRLVIYEIKNNFARFNQYIDDLISYGIIGLVKSVDNFDLSKNIKFSTYAIKCIDNEILIYLRTLRKYNKFVDVFSDKNISFEDEIYKYINIDSNPDIEFNCEKKEVISIIRGLVEKLPSRDREILKLYFGFYDRVYSQVEIAEIYKCNQPWISKIINRNLKHIEAELKTMEIIDTSYKLIRRKR